jgi:hypothetical protein
MNAEAPLSDAGKARDTFSHICVLIVCPSTALARA